MGTPDEPDEDGVQDPAGAADRSAALLEANQLLVVATLRAQAAEEELRESARHRDEFLAMLGHELRNPLVPIRNATEVLFKIAGEDKRVAWVHDVLVRQIGHITRLVDDLPDISLISLRGSTDSTPRPIAVPTSAGSRCKFMAPRSSGRITGA